jgi:hypothetical protein
MDEPNHATPASRWSAQLLAHALRISPTSPSAPRLPTYAGAVWRVVVSAVLFFVLLLLPSANLLRETNGYFLRRSTIK